MESKNKYDRGDVPLRTVHLCSGVSQTSFYGFMWSSELLSDEGSSSWRSHDWGLSPDWTRLHMVIGLLLWSLITDLIRPEELIH